MTITGPRQSGKTTLCRAAFGSKPHVNLEQPDTRGFAQGDPRGILRTYPDGAILDEIQRTPELPSYLPAIVDERPEPGRHILTGSEQLEVLIRVGQFMAGRTGILRLLPFGVEEMSGRLPIRPVERLILSGFYPPIHDRDRDPTRALGDQFATYVQRDLRALVNIGALCAFEKFVRLAAGGSARFRTCRRWARKPECHILPPGNGACSLRRATSHFSRRPTSGIARAARACASIATASVTKSNYDHKPVVIAIQQDCLIHQGIGQRPFLNDAGSGFPHLAVVSCPGRGLVDRGRLEFSGYRAATDRDVDKAVLKWSSTDSGGRCAGSLEWIEGTGTYNGLRGCNTFDAGALGQGATGPVGYANWKGEWNLPEGGRCVELRCWRWRDERLRRR